MAVPKRKAPGGQDSTASPAGAAKRARTEELTGVRFKAQLRDPQGAGQGECGAGRGGEHVRARRPPGLGLGGISVCQTQPLLSVTEPHLPICRRDTEDPVIGRPRSRGRLSATQEGPEVFGCDSSMLRHTSFAWAVTSAESKTSLLQLRGN